MKKWIFSLALIFAAAIPAVSVQEMSFHNHSKSPQKFSPDERGYLSPEEVPTGYLSVKAMELSGFSGENLKKMEEALAVLEKAVNSEEFKDRVINFKNAKGERNFASNKGLSNEEIYAIFMEGRETLQQDTPGEMNFYLRLYYRWFSRVVGYTSVNTNVISVNKKYFRNFEIYDVANNLAHEWTHKIGFDHTSAKEHDSAPYAIGRIVGDIASKMMKNQNSLH